VNTLKHMLHGSNRLRASLLWSNDQLASFIHAADCDQRRCSDGMLLGESFSLLVKNLTVVEAYDKNSAMLRLRELHMPYLLETTIPKAAL
jgi:hypothetical protein